MRRGHTRITITLEMKNSDYFYSPVEVAQTMLSRMFRDGQIGEWANGEVYTGAVPFVAMDVNPRERAHTFNRTLPVSASVRWEKL